MDEKTRSKRSVRDSLQAIKEGVIVRCLNKKLTWKEGAAILDMHPKALSRLKRRYLQHGPQVLVPRKPGPERGSVIPKNKTKSSLEDIIVQLAVKNRKMGALGLARALLKVYGPTLHQSTVWRILKRRGLPKRRLRR